MARLRVALLQTDPQPDAREANVAAAFAAIQEAAAAGAELVVLPEMWPRAYVDALADPDAPEVWAELLERWRALVRDLGIAAIGGLPEQVDGGFENVAYFLGPEGEVLGRYAKVHLFGVMGEDRRYRPGSRPVVVPWRGVRVGLAICYDLRFPELYRALRAAGAELVVTIAQWPASRRDHWDVLLRARAIENLVYHVGVNRVGTVAHAGGHLRFGGGSAAVDPWGEAHWVAGEDVGRGMVEVDLDKVAERRATFPSWEDRRFAVLDPEGERW